MSRIIGPLVMVLGALHVLVAVIAGRRTLTEVVRGGVGGLQAVPAGTEGAFWSVLFGVLLFTAGYQIRWAISQVGTVPAMPGWALVGIGLVSVILAPLSPFWLVLLLGLATVVESWRSRRRGGPNLAVRTTQSDQPQVSRSGGDAGAEDYRAL